MRGVLITKRFMLRQFDSSDVGDLHAMFADPSTNTIGGGPFTAVDQTGEWVTRRDQTRSVHGYCWYGIRERAGGQLLGNCGIFTGRTGPSEPEIGYMVAAAWRGQGIAYEAAAAVLTEALASVPRVWATIRPYNTASLRIAGKLGFVERHIENDERGPLVFLAREQLTEKPQPKTADRTERPDIKPGSLSSDPQRNRQAAP